MMNKTDSSAPKAPAKTRKSRAGTAAPVDHHEPHAPLGQIIRHERSRQNMTLDDLARLSGVSKGMLSQIEQNKTNPTVTVLLRIAAGLRVEPTRLLPTTPHAPRVWRTIRANDEGYRFPANEGCLIRTLSPLDLEKRIELYELTFQPKGSLISEPHYQGTEEILTVVSGRLTVRSGDQENELRKGDSQHYAADVAHRIVNTGSGSASCILLVWYRS
ncbi:MAG TPA: XRE family transcriptional regulator [Chthoniobacteraceae bacterium]|nr:XRE family transcriptional regulator [Chthoniobacteraceae bacterium]